MHISEKLKNFLQYCDNSFMNNACYFARVCSQFNLTQYKNTLKSILHLAGILECIMWCHVMRKVT